MRYNEVIKAKGSIYVKKLLVVESTPYTMERMKQLFGDEWSVLPCYSGAEAIQYLRFFVPDAMIISHRPPQVDSYEILPECFPNIPAVTVALVSSTMAADVNSLARWGVDTLFEFPCDLNVLKNTVSILHRSQGVVARRTSQHLRVLGFSAGSQGYIYLLLSICFFSEDMCQQLHNEVYRKVAEITGTDERNIEKALRLLIRSGWERGKPEIWEKYFPVDKNGFVACPKNREFITSLAQLV